MPPEILQLQPFVTSLGLGLLLGLERERSAAARAGLRTFGLVALLGTLTAMLDAQAGTVWITAAGLLAMALMMIGAYARVRPEDDAGTTTTVSLLLCYVLGAVVWHGHALLAAMLALAATLLLYFKAELHGVASRMSRRELLAILQFAIITFVVLPLLPDRGYGPYGAINPYRIWWMVVLLSGLSLAAYTALRVAGPRIGPLLVAALGGVASSTATTLVMSRHLRSGAATVRLAALVILAANLVVLLRLSVLTVFAGPQMLPLLLPVFAVGLCAGAAVPWLLWRRLGEPGSGPALDLKNPVELLQALGAALIFALVLVGVAWLDDQAGVVGLYGMALISGLTDLDAITLAILRLVGQGNAGLEQGRNAVLIAIGANLSFKLALVAVIGGRALAWRVGGGFLLVAAGLFAGWLLF